jgi:hypothetical protein
MKRDPLIFILEILIYAFFAWQQEGVENNWFVYQSNIPSFRRTIS